MQAKYWEILLSATYKLDKLNPLKWAQNFIFDKYNEADTKEYVPTPAPDYYIGRIESISLSTDDLERITIVLTDENGHTCRIFGCMKESTMAFNILGDYGLFKKMREDTRSLTEATGADSLYRLLFVKHSHKEALDSYLDFYHEHDSNKILVDLCDQEITNE